MRSYHCYDAEDNYRIAYTRDDLGHDEFFNLLERLGAYTEPSEIDPLAELRALHSRPRSVQLTCPRLFVSHRQCDSKEALRVAWLANQHQFDYWLDVLDPHIAAAAVRPNANAYQQAVLMAAIIEMGLLNCTHVLAVMTKNVRGTLWMPYEYGRVKDSNLTSTKVAAWLDSSWNISNTPEYFQLGRQFTDEPDIEHWLDAEFAQWCVQSPAASSRCPSSPWPLAETPVPWQP